MTTPIELIGLLGSLASMISLTEQAAESIRISSGAGAIDPGPSPDDIVSISRDRGRAQAKNVDLSIIAKFPSSTIDTLVKQARRLDADASKAIKSAYPDTFKMLRITQQLKADLCEVLSAIKSLTGGTLPSPLDEQWVTLGC